MLPKSVLRCYRQGSARSPPGVSLLFVPKDLGKLPRGSTSTCCRPGWEVASSDAAGQLVHWPELQEGEERLAKTPVVALPMTVSLQHPLLAKLSITSGV